MIKPWLARQAYSLVLRLATPAYLWRIWSRGKVEPGYVGIKVNHYGSQRGVDIVLDLAHGGTPAVGGRNHHVDGAGCQHANAARKDVGVAEDVFHPRFADHGGASIGACR